MTVPQLIDLCGKRQWSVEITGNGPSTSIKIYAKSGALLGQSASIHANEGTFALALIQASRKPSETED